jgi:hypothetical protein
MENSQLTLNDIVSVKNLIEAACSRGSFKAHEMRGIGELYEKIVRFIESTQPSVAPTDQPEASVPEGESNA